MGVMIMFFYYGMQEVDNWPDEMPKRMMIFIGDYCEQTNRILCLLQVLL